MAVQISGNDITVPRDTTVTRNLTVGGVLTYEDVTNVDSVGLVTARSGIEIGARPGVAASISVDGNMIISGISTFGGDIKTSASNIVLGDSGGSSDDRLVFGAGSDLSIYHASNISTIVDTYGDLRIMSDTIRIQRQAGGENFLYGTEGGKVSLYYDGGERVQTIANGILVTGGEGAAGEIQLSADEGDDNADKFDIRVTSGGIFKIQNYASGSWEDNIACNANGAVELYHDNELQALTAGNGLRIKTAGDTDTELSVVGPEGRNGIINLEADDGDDNADIWGLVAGTDGKFLLRNYTSGSYENNLRATGNGAVELYYDNSVRLLTTTSGVTAGTPNTSQTAVVGAQAGFFGGAKSLYASATGLVQNQVCILDTATSAAAGTGGALTFAGYTDSDSTTFYATIEGVKENSTVNQYGGELRFLTRAHNVGNMNQAMMIDSAGKVFVSNMGRGVDGSTSNLAVYGNSSTATGNVPLSCYPANASSTRHMISFSNANGVIGSISTNGSNTAYNTSSDYRLKENTVAISDGITRLKTLKPIRFNFIKDASTTIDGFLAHEVSDAVPSAVTGEKDGMAGETFYEEGDELPSGKEYGDVKTYSTTKIEPQQLDQTKLVPLLTAALQEAVTEIESLKARLDAAGL